MRSPRLWATPRPAQSSCRMLAISSGWSFRPGGIFSSPDCSMARTSRLSAGLPGLIAAPRLPPARMASREVSASPLDLVRLVVARLAICLQDLLDPGWFGWRGLLSDQHGFSNQHRESPERDQAKPTLAVYVHALHIIKSGRVSLALCPFNKRPIQRDPAGRKPGSPGRDLHKAGRSPLRSAARGAAFLESQYTAPKVSRSIESTPHVLRGSIL